MDPLVSMRQQDVRLHDLGKKPAGGFFGAEKTFVWGSNAILAGQSRTLISPAKKESCTVKQLVYFPQILHDRSTSGFWIAHYSLNEYGLFNGFSTFHPLPFVFCCHF